MKINISELLGDILARIPKKQEPKQSAQQTLLLEKVWADGLMRAKGAPPTYSKTIRFSDISYTLLDEDDRKAVLDRLGRLFHVFEDGIHLQLTYTVSPKKVKTEKFTFYFTERSSTKFEVEKLPAYLLTEQKQYVPDKERIEQELEKGIEIPGVITTTNKSLAMR